MDATPHHVVAQGYLIRRLEAYSELLADKAIASPEVTLMQVALPSRENVDAYRHLRRDVERTVGGINGDFSALRSASWQCPTCTSSTHAASWRRCSCPPM